MDKFTAMQVFCRVYEAESFRVASESLDISRPMVTRYVNFLEESLGTKLLYRNTRNIRPTHAGGEYYRHCLAILDALEEAEAELGDLASQPKGNLRISVPMDFGLTHIIPLLAEFSDRYPDIQLDIDFSDRRVDLTESGIDLAIRGGSLGGDQFIARPLCDLKTYLCASPAYLARYGTPRTVEDLKEHNCLLYTHAPYENRWPLYRADEEVLAEVSGNMKANNGGALTRMAVAGAGIIYQPDFLVDQYLERGELVRVLPEYDGFTGRFHAVFAQRKLMPRKTRLLLDFLQDKLQPTL